VPIWVHTEISQKRQQVIAEANFCRIRTSQWLPLLQQWKAALSSIIHT